MVLMRVLQSMFVAERVHCNRKVRKVIKQLYF